MAALYGRFNQQEMSVLLVKVVTEFLNFVSGHEVSQKEGYKLMNSPFRFPFNYEVISAGENTGSLTWRKGAFPKVLEPHLHMYMCVCVCARACIILVLTFRSFAQF